MLIMFPTIGLTSSSSSGGSSSSSRTGVLMLALHCQMRQLPRHDTLEDMISPNVVWIRLWGDVERTEMAPGRKDIE